MQTIARWFKRLLSRGERRSPHEKTLPLCSYCMAEVGADRKCSCRSARIQEIPEEIGLLEHSPRNRRTMDAPELQAEYGCAETGQPMVIYLSGMSTESGNNETEELIDEVSFEGNGCPVCLVSASLLTTTAPGWSADQFLELARHVQWLAGHRDGIEWVTESEVVRELGVLRDLRMKRLDELQSESSEWGFPTTGYCMMSPWTRLAEMVSLYGERYESLRPLTVSRGVLQERCLACGGVTSFEACHHCGAAAGDTEPVHLLSSRRLNDVDEAPRLVDDLRVTGWIIVQQGQQRGHDFRIHRGTNTIGSSPNCDITLGVKPLHAMIVCHGDTEFTLVDKSGNGVLVNSARVSRIELLSTDTVQLPGTEFSFRSLR